MSPARRVAFEILKATAGGGFAGDLLMARTASLSERDAALASEIVFGVLRRRRQLDFLLGYWSGRDVERLDAPVRIILEMAVLQLVFLDRVPAHAAVNESVELVKRARQRSAAGLVNAVLRKVTRRLPPWPDESTELSLPEWLLDRWRRQFGEPAARELGLAFLKKPDLYVRLNRVTPEEAGQLEKTEIPGCYRAFGDRPPGARVQDIGSQAIVPLLDLRPGQLFLDVCAAPGNKTGQATEYGVQAVACDSHLGKLRNFVLPDCPRAAADATRGLPFGAVFDRILVDAPCSGTGTLGRNPEIRWRLTPDDLPRHAGRQKAILGNSLKCLKPGGLLVYSTCSLEREENEDVVSELAGARVRKEMRRMPGRDAGDGFYAAVIGSE